VSRRWRATDAYVDESQRGARYVMGCVMTDARDHPELRRRVTTMLRPRQRRIHFYDESLASKRRLLDGFAGLPIRAIVVVARIDHDSNSERARAVCLTRLVELLQDRGVSRVVIESRDDDRIDVRTVIAARRPTPLLVFEHRPPDGEPLLWIADGVAWAGGLSSRELERLGPVLERLIQIDR
jgi:hypothetical protein